MKFPPFWSLFSTKPLIDIFNPPSSPTPVVYSKVLNCGRGSGTVTAVAGDADAILRIAVTAAMIFFKVAQNAQ